MSEEYTGKSILDGLEIPPGPVAVPTGSGGPTGPQPRALLLELDGGGSVSVEHDGDPEEAPTERRWGQEYVCFADGNRVRADRILRYRSVTAQEAREEAARAPEAVRVYLAGVQQAPPQETLEDRPYSMWPLDALIAEEKELVLKCNPNGGVENVSADLTEVRDAIAKRKASA